MAKLALPLAFCMFPRPPPPLPTPPPRRPSKRRAPRLDEREHAGLQTAPDAPQEHPSSPPSPPVPNCKWREILGEHGRSGEIFGSCQPSSPWWSLIALDYVHFSQKALSRRRNESRPRSARWRCNTSARRRDETSIGTSVSPQPAVTPSPQATRNPPPLPVPSL